MKTFALKTLMVAAAFLFFCSTAAKAQVYEFNETLYDGPDKIELQLLLCNADDRSNHDFDLELRDETGNVIWSITNTTLRYYWTVTAYLYVKPGTYTAYACNYDYWKPYEETFEARWDGDMMCIEFMGPSWDSGSGFYPYYGR